MPSKKGPATPHHPEADRYKFILDTLTDGWCLATPPNTYGGIDIAVAPDGTYAKTWWDDDAECECRQIDVPWERECFGSFVGKALWTAGECDFRASFVHLLPMLQEAHRRWRQAPNLSSEGKPVLYISGDPKRDLEFATRGRRPPPSNEMAAVIDATYEILKARKPKEQALNTIAMALGSPYQSIWLKAGETLIVLSYYFPEAAAALIGVMSHKKSQARLHAVQSIFYQQPEERISKTIFASGLKDKSKKVRQFAADRLTYRFRDLLPQLEEAISIEHDSKLRHEMREKRSYLRFGVVVEQRKDKSEYDVSVYNGRSYVGGNHIPISEFHKHLLVDYVKEHDGDLKLLADWTNDEILVEVP